MTKLLGIRTVYDVDPTKTFRIADILTDGALLPHSVTLAELMVMDLEPADGEDDSKACNCYEYAGDNKDCPIHSQYYHNDSDFSDSDIRDHAGIYSLGMGV